MIRPVTSDGVISPVHQVNDQPGNSRAVSGLFLCQMVGPGRHFGERAMRHFPLATLALLVPLAVIACGTPSTPEFVQTGSHERHV